jgi:hypothetical protein
VPPRAARQGDCGARGQYHARSRGARAWCRSAVSRRTHRQTYGRSTDLCSAEPRRTRSRPFGRSHGKARRRVVVALRSRRIIGTGTPESVWAGWPGFAQMSAIEAVALVPPGRRALVVAPHPDDEVLGVGGLLAQLVSSESEILIIALTDGEASHPGSARWPPLLLAEQRAMERSRALRKLGVETATVIRAKHRDGALRAQENEIVASLSRYIGSNDVVFVPVAIRWAPRPRGGGTCSGASGIRCAGQSWSRYPSGCGTGQRLRMVVSHGPVLGVSFSIPRCTHVSKARWRHFPVRSRRTLLPVGALCCPATALARLLRPFEVVFV